LLRIVFHPAITAGGGIDTTRLAFAGLATLPLVWSVASAGTLTPLAPYRDYATTGVE